MDRFVVGFAFNKNADSVLLVRKLRPEWQKGFFNGIGGKMENGESPFDAMSRECKEETALSLDWSYRGLIKRRNPNYECHIFYAYSQRIFDYRQKKDELLEIYFCRLLESIKVVEDLHFLIPFGIHSDISIFMTLEYPK